MGQEKTAQTKQPKGIRLPIVRTAADIDKLPHLSDEEKALAKANLKKVAPSDGWYLLGNNPELQWFWQLIELALVHRLAPDAQMIPFSPMNLICHEVIRHSGCEWHAGAMSAVTATTIGTDWQTQEAHYAQLGMLAFPDSKVWNDEQRLTLKFTRACLKNTMTDDLFNQARTTWGEQKLLRHIVWSGFVHTWTMITTSANLSWSGASSWPMPPRAAMEPVGVVAQKVWEGLRAHWDKVPFLRTDGVTPEGPPVEFRLPLVHTVADVDALSHLSEEEKILARDNAKRVPPSDGWYLMANDPELQVVLHFVELGLAALLSPDTQLIPFGSMNLICLAVARHMGCEWHAGIMNTVNASIMEAWQEEDLHYSQLGMVTFPDSKVWNDEQRLTLKFTQACITHSMTDELFNQARQTWGEKKSLNIIVWIGYVHTWAMLMNANNAYWSGQSKWPVLPRAAVESMNSYIQKILEEVRSVWATVPDMF